MYINSVCLHPQTEKEVLRFMRSRKSLQLEVIVLTMVFALLIAIVVSASSLAAAGKESRRAVVQGAEYSLQVAAGDLSRSVSEIDSLADWCTANATLRNYMLYNYNVRDLLIGVYNTASNKYTSMRTARYMQRFIITNGSDRLLQLGTITSQSRALTAENIPQLPYLSEGGRQNSWCDVVNDPLLLSGTVQYIPVTRTIAGPNGHTGWVYISVSTSLVTDVMRSSSLLEESDLFWIMNGRAWRILDTGLEALPDASLTRAEGSSSLELLDARTTVWELADSDQLILGYPVGSSGLYVARTVPLDSLRHTFPSLPTTMIFGIFGILVLGMLLATLLRGVIAKPVRAIQDQLERISEGDFTPNPAIEWNNEMGDIGRGINRLSVSVSALMEKRLEDERTKRDLEYRMLQNQINPHFLYNTLNSIKWMATIQHAPGIAEMTTALSRLLKSVSKGNERLVPLQDEFALLNDYFTIQQYRYGGTVTMDVTYIEDERLCQDCLIPRFTLQPLVENAILHGIEPKGCAGSIALTVTLDGENGDVLIALTDDGVGMTAEQAAKALTEPGPEEAAAKYRHVGMWNVHKRLQYSFGEEYGLSIRSVPGQGTTVTVRLPRHPVTDTDRELPKEADHDTSASG